MRYFMDVLDAEFAGELHAGDVDEKGAIRQHPDLLEAAFALGIRLAQPRSESQE